MADTAVSIALKMQDQASAPMKRAMNQIDRSASTARRSTTKLSDSIGAVYKHLAALGIMVGVRALVRGFIRIADSLTLVEGRLSLVTSSSKELAQVQNELFQVANQTRVTYQGTADLYARLARSTEDLNISQENLIQTTKTINQALIVSGASATEASAALIQLSQGLASGALRGDELRSVLEQTPRLARAMAEGLGVGIGQLRELGAAGELTAEKVISSLLSQKDVIEREFGKMPITVGQAMTILNNEIGRLVSGADDATSLTAELAEGIRNFASAIHEIDTKIFADVADLISALWDVMTAFPEGFIDFFTRAEDKIEDATKAVDAQRTSYENLVNYLSWFFETCFAALVLWLKEIGNFFGFMLAGIIEFVKGSGRWLKTWADLVIAAFSFDKEGIKKACGEIWGEVLDETIKGLDANAKAFEAGAREAWEDYLKVYGRLPDLVEPIIDRFEKAGDFARNFAADIRDAGESVQVSVSKMGDRIDKVFDASLSKLVKLMNESKTAMDRVTLAAMPEYERGLEQIARRYKELNAALDEWGTLAGKTIPEIARLHEDLGLRMDEEINDYVKSHETGTDTIYDTWSHMYERLQDITADWIYDMKVDFDSIVDLFKRTVAEMISAWIWGQQSMQFATSGQGGFSLGNMFGGMFGGGGGGMTGQTAVQAAMAAGHGPVSEEWALSQGFRNTAQGASAAWSLKGAYGAYGAAGGGWAGIQAGAGSLGGGIGAGISGISWTGWAAIAYFASELLSGMNVKKGYGQLTYAPRGYGYGGEFQPTSPFQGDFGTDPLGTYIRGVLGIDDIPMAGNYFSAAIKESDWWEAMKALPATILEWSSPFVTMALSAFGLDMGKIFGFGNKKRSYYGKSFEFGEYSPDIGWGDPTGEVYRDKRKGEKAFGESGESMAENALALMNSMDNLFKNMLGAFGENWQNLFKTQMIDLAAQGLSFDFYISAEDKEEFKDDWKKSWVKMTEGVIGPIVTIGTDLLSQVLDGVVTDAVAWNYFSDEMREHLKTGLEDGLVGLKVDWSTITDQESFERAFEQMGLAAEQIADIVGYFEAVGSVLDNITSAIDMHEFSSNANAAIAGFRAINAEFEQYALTLESMGVDPEKYTDLEKAHLMALQDEAKAMSDAAMSGEDLALALKYMSEEMTEVGHTVEEIAAAMDAANSGILDSIDDIKKRYEDYGKTALDLMYEKYPEWQGMAYEQWAGTDLTDWSTEMLQEWRNLGDLLEAQWEEQQALLDNSLADIVDEITKANQTELKELERLIDSFIKASDAIVDYQESLLASSPGMLSPDVQYAQASQQLDSTIQDLYSKDRETALAASQAIPGYVDQFLDASKAFSATPEQYMADFARAMAVLNTANEINLDWQKNLQSSILSQNSSSYAALVEAYLNRSPTVHLYTGSPMWDTLFGPVYGLRSDPNYGPRNRMLYDPTFNPMGGGGYDDYYGLALGGLISGPESGFNAPITFHGTEHVIPGDQMKEVKEILGEVKEVLIQVRDTSGDQNKVNKKLYRIIDRVSQGEEYLMTKAV